MTIRDAFRGAIVGFRNGLDKGDVSVIPGLTVAPAVPIGVGVAGAGGANAVTVVDTLQLPTSDNVPSSWSRQWMGPGRPWVALGGMTFVDQEREMEPRTFQYITSVNSTISPRLAYSLMSFAELKYYASNVPEVALCVRLPTEELKSFIPTLVDDDDNKVDIPELQWMVEKPDRVNPWPVWLSRFLYNVLVYDAPALYKMRGKSTGMHKRRATLVNIRDGGNGYGSVPMLEWYCPNCKARNLYDAGMNLRKCSLCDAQMPKAIVKDIAHDEDIESRPTESPIVGLRIIDGSTIFSVIDERGEQPMPPAPAFTQVIWGVPRMYLNTYQLWYRPRHLRPDAPYGRTFIEDALPAIKLLSQLWEYEGDKYIVGNIPEMGLTSPPEWKSAEQILEFEEAFNARMAGNSKERAGRIRFFPAGVEAIATKDMTFNRETYDAASNAVRIAAGIPKSEVGEAPEGMLGGKSYAEAMSSGFYRMCISPLQSFVESAFNDAIKENGFDGTYFKLKFPNESIDPEKEETKFVERFTCGGIKRDEYREAIGMSALGGDEGNYLYTPGAGQEEDGSDPAGSFGGKGRNGKPGRSVGVIRRPVRVIDKPVGVLDEPVRVKKGEMGEELARGTNLVERQVLELGNKLGVDWEVIPLRQFMVGFLEEQEHAETVEGDQEIIAQIAIDHLTEDLEYYDKLRVAMAKIGMDVPVAKLSGVDLDDDAYYGMPITLREDVEMPHQGANKSCIVGIGGLGQDIRPAVWKPVDGEDPKLQKWIGGELYRRSEAVYLIDRELAKDANHYLVPVTWCDQLAGVDGSIQYYVRGRRAKKLVTDYDCTFIEQAAVLDFITGQVDRVSRNILTHPVDDKRPILIDNDLSFPTGQVNIRSSFIDIMRDKELSKAILDSIFLLMGNHDLWADLRECVGDAAAVKGAQDRAKVLYENNCIPSVIMHDREVEVIGEKE